MAFHKELDKKSLKFKIWAYFSLFAVIILIILWLLQTIFLGAYYETMKSHELMSTAEKIQRTYAKGNDMSNVIGDITLKSDLYIYLEDNTTFWYSSGTNSSRMPGLDTMKNLDRIKLQVNQSLSGYVTATVHVDGTQGDVKVYATNLKKSDHEEAFLFMMAPLSPLSSTIDILSSQLIIVSVISILIGIIMSAVISRRLTKPLEKISNSAVLLAQGDYDVHFDGGHYSEVVELADTLNYAAGELSKSDSLHKDLIANVSHDLKTPLTMVKSYAEMIRDLSGNNPIKRNQHLEVIIQEADRLNELVNDMTTLSKMQSGIDEKNETIFDLRKVTEDILNRFSLYPEAVNIDFKFESPDTAFVKADEGKISQAFYNLLGNAVKYGIDGKEIKVRLVETENDGKSNVSGEIAAHSPKINSVVSGGNDAHEGENATDTGVVHLTSVRSDNHTAGNVVTKKQISASENSNIPVIGRVRIQRSGRLGKPVKPPTKYIRCEIIDKGPGIPPEECDAIWDRYYRASSNLTREKKGTGLGLSIVKEIMNLHKAGFGVKSEVGVGSTFYFVLKEYENPAAAPVSVAERS